MIERDSFEDDLNEYYRQEDKYNDYLEKWQNGVKYKKGEIKSIILDLIDIFKPNFDEDDEPNQFADRLVEYIEEDIEYVVETCGLDFFEDDIYDLVVSYEPKVRYSDLEYYILSYFEDYDLEKQEEFNKVMGY